MAFLPAIAPALGVISSLIGAAGAVYSGIAAKNAADYQSAVARQNANIAEENARRVVERSQIKQQDQDMQSMAELGTQEAIQAASGLSITGGSQMLSRKAAAELGRRDALNVRQDGELESYNFKTQAVNQRAEAQLAKMKGQSSLIGGYLQGAGGLLSGLATVKNPERFKQA